MSRSAVDAPGNFSLWTYLPGFESLRSQRVRDIANKIKEIAKYALISLLAVTMCIVNPNIFIIGLVVGVTFDDHIQRMAGKITTIWNRYPWRMSLVIGVATYISPVAMLAFGSFFVASSLSSYVSRQCHGYET